MSASLKELQAAAKKKWASSGLTDAHAKKLRFEILTGQQTGRLDGAFKPVGALRIPYFDMKGKPTKFYRVRYLEAQPGFAGLATKPQRYAQPAGTLNEVYAPPLLDHTWEEIFADPEVTLYITEGEFKSAAGCSVGLPTLGLGGVDVWRATRRGVGMLPMLREVNWDGRQVVIVYDSDAATNEHVVRAQRVLAQALLDEGALPSVASLPADGQGAKQGLDDFLVAQGAEALEELLADAPAWAEASALWEMNEEVVYLRDPGLVVVRASHQKLAPQAFTSHAYANRHYLEVGEGAAKRKPTAKRWVEWERRFELEKITYRPGSPQVVDDCWNTWKGWGLEPKKGNIKPWQDLLDFLFKDADPGAQEWFEKWCAYPLQHPGTKMFSSVLMWGVTQGTGKTLCCYTLRNIYGDNFVEIKSKDLKGSFNAWADCRQFVYGDEITGGDKSDKKIDADYLKGIITQEHLRINVKFVPEFVVPDVINYYFSSNHPDAFFIEDTDRRFFINEVIGGKLPKSFYETYDKWLKGGGSAHVFHHLLQLPLTGFDPHGEALQTSSKKSMINDSKSDVAVWCAALREDPETKLRARFNTAARDCALFTTAQLHRAYDPEGRSKVTVNGLGRELKRCGFRQVNRGDTVRTSAGCQRLYIVRNEAEWAGGDAAEAVSHWDAFFGPKRKKF